MKEYVVKDQFGETIIMASRTETSADGTEKRFYQGDVLVATKKTGMVPIRHWDNALGWVEEKGNRHEGRENCVAR